MRRGRFIIVAMNENIHFGKRQESEISQYNPSDKLTAFMKEQREIQQRMNDGEYPYGDWTEKEWFAMSQNHFVGAYGDDEPDYHISPLDDLEAMANDPEIQKASKEITKAFEPTLLDGLRNINI